MPNDLRTRLAGVQTFPQLVAFLHHEMGWPIETDDFDELTFEYTAEELGIDTKNAAKIEKNGIKRLRPLIPNQPWGVFFVKFEPKRLPVVALRRILSSVALKKRKSANPADRTAWSANDLLFVSSYGEKDDRNITFAHFAHDEEKGDLPTLKVLGWDDQDTALHLADVAEKLKTRLSWPADPNDLDSWRRTWRSAFTLRHGEVITTSKALAVRLAELARAIRERALRILAVETDDGPLRKLQKVFREALIHDLDGKGFADMYAQTIAYGLLSARVTNPKANTAEGFAVQLPVTNPFLKELMETFLHVGGRKGKAGKRGGLDFDELGVSEVVELLDRAHMEAVVQDFGDKNPQEDPVIHFYELFLKEYDAKKRLQRGVFYTPRPVVSYIVRSVDELLRTEFGLADGLADTTTWGEMARRHKGLKLPDGVSPDQDFVQILDPATGTGTFLIEALDVIAATMKAKWSREIGLTPPARREDLIAWKHPRINELWNEYVPKHVLMRLHGYELLMAPYAIAHLKLGLKLYETGYRFGSAERSRVYLTNAIEPAQDFSDSFEFAIPALAHEAQAVNEIKRQRRFTVVIGNPPYSRLSQNQGEWIDSVMERYKTTIKTEEIQRQALSNDYVKFMCLASAVLERSGMYVLGMITDNSYLDGPLFRDMRADLMKCFQVIRITDLGGNSRRVDATEADQNVFDIQQGVAIFLGSTVGGAVQHVYLTAVGGTRDEKALWLSSNTAGIASFSRLTPVAPQRYFQPSISGTSSAWESWRSLPELFAGGLRSGRPLPFNGAALATRHDTLAIAFTRAELRENLQVFYDQSESRQRLKERFGLCSTSHFDFDRARTEATLKDVEACIRPILYRPFDMRYVAYHPLIIGEPRPEVMKHLLAGSLALLSTRRVTGKAYDNVLVCRGLVEYKAVTHDRNTQVFPLYLAEGEDETSLFATGTEGRRHPNLTPAVFSDWRKQLGVHTAEEVFYAIYALLFSPEYRRRFQGELQRDYARLPQPSSPALNRKLIEFGSTLVALHLMESPMLGGSITTYAGPKNPEVGRVGWAAGTVWLDAVAPRKGQSAKPGTVGFRGVPEPVWNFYIGGYQVCEKWLKDRKGRRLSKDDIAHYQRIVVALAETIRLMKEIDEVIEQHGGWPGAFRTGEVGAAVAGVVTLRPRRVDPKPGERYVTCAPLVPLEVAAGAFGGARPGFDEGEVEWVEVGPGHRLRPGMFVAQVTGKSMEPEIPDGAYCLFRAPVDGSRQGKTVLVELRDAVDPETGQRYTVKRYESEKGEAEDSWRHVAIILRPVNPEFAPIVLEAGDEERLRVVAELVEVLRPPEEAPREADEEARETAVSASRAEPGEGRPARGRAGVPDLPGTSMSLFSDEDEPAPPRKISDVEPAEAMCAIRDLFESAEAREGLDRKTAIRSVARALGFGRTGPTIRDAIDSFLTAAARRGIVETRGGRLYLVARSMSEYHRDLLKDQFVASLGGHGWTDREEAIRAFARWMGYGRTGPTIAELAKSLINGLLREGRIESSAGEIRRAR